MSTQYIVDNDGNRVSVILPVEEYQALLEDLEDLAAVAERRDEPVVSLDELTRRLKDDDLI